jgi:hypothetical protein
MAATLRKTKKTESLCVRVESGTMVTILKITDSTKRDVSDVVRRLLEKAIADFKATGQLQTEMPKPPHPFDIGLQRLAIRYVEEAWKALNDKKEKHKDG